MLSKNLNSPTNVAKRKRGRPRKSEVEGSMPDSINQAASKRKGKPKTQRMPSNPLENFQNITNEDAVVEYEVERIVDKEIDPITNQVWYWVKFKDISDTQRIAAEDCNCEEFIQEYERRMLRNRKNNAKILPSTSASIPARSSSMITAPPRTDIINQNNNNSALDDSDSSSEDDANSDNEQSFESWPRSVVEKRTNPAGDVLYKVKFESIFFRWVNPKTDNTSSRQTLQELCNEYEKAIANMVVKDERVEESRRTRVPTQPRGSSAFITNNNNSNNNENERTEIKLLVEELKQLRREQEQIRLHEEQTRKEEERRRQDWLSKVTSDLEEKFQNQESLFKEKEEELKRKAREQEEEMLRKTREAQEKVSLAQQLIEVEEQRFQEAASRFREAHKIVSGKPTAADPIPPVQNSNPLPVFSPPAPTPHPIHVPHAASPSTDSGISSPPGHSGPNTPSVEDTSLQNSIALMLHDTDPILFVPPQDTNDDMMGLSAYDSGTPRSIDMFRFWDQLQNHIPSTISPTVLPQDMGMTTWPYTLPEETEHWDGITDNLQKDTTDGALAFPALPISAPVIQRPIPPPQIARPLHVPRLALPHGATATLSTGEIISVPGGKPKGPPKRKTKPKTDEVDKKAKKAVSKKTTAPPAKPPLPSKPPC